MLSYVMLAGYIKHSLSRLIPQYTKRSILSGQHLLACIRVEHFKLRRWVRDLEPGSFLSQATISFH